MTDSSAFPSLELTNSDCCCCQGLFARLTEVISRSKELESESSARADAVDSLRGQIYSLKTKVARIKELEKHISTCNEENSILKGKVAVSVFENEKLSRTCIELTVRYENEKQESDTQVQAVEEQLILSSAEVSELRMTLHNLVVEKEAESFAASTSVARLEATEGYLSKEVKQLNESLSESRNGCLDLQNKLGESFQRLREYEGLCMEETSHLRLQLAADRQIQLELRECVHLLSGSLVLAESNMSLLRTEVISLKADNEENTKCLECKDAECQSLGKSQWLLTNSSNLYFFAQYLI